MGGIDLLMGRLSVTLGGMVGILSTAPLEDVTTLLGGVLSLTMGGIMRTSFPPLQS
jgi:hypothetical protein